MNKIKSISLALIAFTIFISSCGPAAENREAMHARAKVFQDSIANSIRASFAEAESPAPMPTTMPSNTAAPTTSSQAK